MTRSPQSRSRNTTDFTHRGPFRQPLVLAYFAVAGTLLLTMAVTLEVSPQPTGRAALEPAAAEPFAHLPDPAYSALADLSQSTVGGVVTLEHRVPIGDGRELFVTETFSVASLYRFPRRAMLFLSGSAFRGNHWSIPVEGYDATAMAARRGFFAFTVDYLGVGESFAPQDGTEVTFEANLEAMRTLIRYIRWRRLVPRVDLVGAGYGGSLAAVLGEDPSRVRSVVMSAMLYDVSIGGPLQDPDFVEMLEDAPNGYAFLPGEASLIFTQDAPQELNDYIVATQGGFYPAENFLVATRQLPFYDPGGARVPGLILFGLQDDLVGPDGMDGLARDYGGSGALMVVNEDAAHAPRTESPEVAAWFWRNVWAFLDPDPYHGPGTAGSSALEALPDPPPGDPWIDGTRQAAPGPPPQLGGGEGDIPAGIEFYLGPGEPDGLGSDGGIAAGIELEFDDTGGEPLGVELEFGGGTSSSGEPVGIEFHLGTATEHSAGGEPAGIELYTGTTEHRH